MAVLGKIFGGPGPSFGRQQRLSEIYYRTNSTSSRTTVSNNWGAGQDLGGAVPPGPNVEPPLEWKEREGEEPEGHGKGGSWIFGPPDLITYFYVSYE